MRAAPSPADYDGWVHALGTSTRRQRAKQHLRFAGGPAVPALRRGLRHPKPIVRQMCVRILDQLLDEDAVPDLVAALDDTDPSVVARALHSLACDQCKQNACRPADDLFVPRAFELLRDPNPDLRAAAIDALRRVSGRSPEVRMHLARAIELEPDRRLRDMARR